MRVVVDTNVLVSGIFFAGTPGRILDASIDGQFELVASPEILEEYLRVVERLERQFPLLDARPILDLVVRGCHLVDPTPIDPSACDDPDDLKFLACALAGSSPCIISGDRALLRASGYSGIEVMTPRTFARRHLLTDD